MKSEAPSEKARPRSFRTVTMMTGMSRRTGSAFSATSTDQPSMRGISTSSVIAWGLCARACSSASSPERAWMTR
jgi:hypothetical protein